MEEETLLPKEESEPPAFVANWVHEIIGPFRSLSRYAHDHNYSKLWRLQTDTPHEGHSLFWVKCHQYPGKWAGEINALANWALPLSLPAPRIIGFSDEPRAVLLTEVQGWPADSIRLENKEEQKLWFSAGEYLRRLHTLENDWFGAVNSDGTPQGDTHHDAEAFVRRSIESRLKQGKEAGLFDTEEAAFIAYGAGEWSAALRGEIPRAIHRDYSPRNWMTEENGVLHGVIDFEHARCDVRAADLNRWWDKEFLEKPHLAHTFFDGYQGGMPDDKLRAQIRAMRLLGAAAGVVWATQVGDAPYAKMNREALHRLMDEREKSL